MSPTKKLTVDQLDAMVTIADQLHERLERCETISAAQEAFQRSWSAFAAIGVEFGMGDDVLGTDGVHNATAIVRFLGYAGLTGDQLKKVARDTAVALQNIALAMSVGGPVLSLCCRAAIHHHGLSICAKMLTM